MCRPAPIKLERDPHYDPLKGALSISTVHDRACRNEVDWQL